MQNNTMEEEIKKELIRFSDRMGYNYSEEALTAFTELQEYVLNKIHLAEQSLVQRIIDDITFLAEPYDNAKWNNIPSLKSILSLPSLTPKPKGDK